MNPAGLAVFTAGFLLIGGHHYRRHRELEGLERFMQFKDLRKAVWYLVKSHEGWQLVCLIGILVSSWT